MKYTAEQQAIIEAPLESAVVAALAGTGKSTTILAKVKTIPSNVRVHLAAFNKSTAENLKGKTFGQFNVDAATCNSTGLSMISRPFSRKTNTYFWFAFADEIEIALRLKKRAARAIAVEVQEVLWGHGSLDCPANIDQKVWDLHLSMLRKSISFDHQWWLPVVTGTARRIADVVFIDEAQDWCPVQQQLLLSLAPVRIAVGDQHQTIYEWRGVESNSMSAYEGTKYPLTGCFRCSPAIIARAQEFVPEIRYGGHPAECDNPTLTLSRFNAPLAKKAVQLLREGKRPEITGPQTLKAQMNNVLDIMDGTINSSALEAHIEKKRYGKKRTQALWDVFETIIALKSIDEDPIKALDKLKTKNPTHLLSTIHRAKGLESKEVIFLDPTWDEDYRLNYVAVTRAIDTFHANIGEEQ